MTLRLERITTLLYFNFLIYSAGGAFAQCKDIKTLKIYVVKRHFRVKNKPTRFPTP